MSEDRSEQHKHFAVAFNQRAWGLLGKETRSAAEDDELVHAAHASLLHWLAVGTAVHHQRGQWLLSHVYARLGFDNAALRHARRCAALTEESGAALKDFDKAYAEEALARALWGSDRPAAEQHRVRAKDLGEGIADPEDRKIFQGDFAAGPWASSS